jgi:anti-anti-sigma factor
MPRLQEHLGAAGEALVTAVTGRLCGRSGSGFRTHGPEPTARAVRLLLDALRRDLANDGKQQLRTSLRNALAELPGQLVSYHDLRLLDTSLRAELLASLDPIDLPRETLRRIEDWCHELALQCGLYTLTLREELIERQASEIEMKVAEQRQLSIPIAPIHDGVLVVPLVGALDDYRAQVLTHRILDAISQSRTQLLLLDISGVDGVDGDVAGRLLQTVKAARLLGTEVVLVGISPAAARIIIAENVDLGRLVCLRSLKEGLAFGLARLGLQLVAAPKKPAATRP